MDEFQSWVISHWITAAALAGLLLNLSLAIPARRTQIQFGAIALLCSWVATIGSVLLLRDEVANWARLVIDILAMVFFYRLSERDQRTGERHDWAAFICFAYFWLAVVDILKSVGVGGGGTAYIATSNVIFVLKLLANMLPAISIILRKIPIFVHVAR